MSSENEILFERRGAAGIITLNRPKALNAVTHEMVCALARQLAEWQHDGAVTRVVITAAGERAFSAGGDIRALYEIGRAGRQAEALTFWREEYPLNAMIKRYPKPYVALIDGIVMGGGVGVSVHGSHRVAGDKFLFAMPEVGIGFFPDVGGTWFLPRMPGELGAWCAITGDRPKPADGGAAGTHPPRALGPLCRPDRCAVRQCLGRRDAGGLRRKPGQGPMMARRGAIDRLFAADTVEHILAKLDAEETHDADGEWAAATAAAIRTKSPTSLRLALAQVRRGRDWSFEDCMKAEYRIVSRIVYGHDFYEGVRAAIVDKDNAPRWQPAALADVSAAEVERHFAPLGNDELSLP